MIVMTGILVVYGAPLLVLERKHEPVAIYLTHLGRDLALRVRLIKGGTATDIPTSAPWVPLVARWTSQDRLRVITVDAWYEVDTAKRRILSSGERSNNRFWVSAHGRWQSAAEARSHFGSSGFFASRTEEDNEVRVFSRGGPRVVEAHAEMVDLEPSYGLIGGNRTIFAPQAAVNSYRVTTRVGNKWILSRLAIPWRPNPDVRLKAGDLALWVGAREGGRSLKVFFGPGSPSLTHVLLYNSGRG